MATKKKKRVWTNVWKAKSFDGSMDYFCGAIFFTKAEADVQKRSDRKKFHKQITFLV